MILWQNLSDDLFLKIYTYRWIKKMRLSLQRIDSGGYFWELRPTRNIYFLL